MKLVDRSARDTIELKPRECVPVGPVRIANMLPPPPPVPPPPIVVPPPPPRDFPFGVKVKDRVSGWIYDAHTGALLGIASFELLRTQPVGVVFTRIVGGMKQDVEIHP